MKIQALKKSDTIGIIAPSRPIYNIEKGVLSGIKIINSRGFDIVKGKFINAHDYYSAGDAAKRLADLQGMFFNPKIKAIICATGGATANQLLENLDYALVRNNPKVFMGYSDITVLLLAMNKLSGLVTFYGPNVFELSVMSKKAQDFIFDMLMGKNKVYYYPISGKAIKPGKANGKLIGGNLSRLNSLLGTPYAPDFTGKILFWEEVGTCPAIIDFELQQLRLAGVFKKIKGMVVGNLADCFDKKYHQDNKSTANIILERTKSFNFPIIKVDYFGHDIREFYCLPIGGSAFMDTKNKLLSVRL